MSGTADERVERVLACAAPPDRAGAAATLRALVAEREAHESRVVSAAVYAVTLAGAVGVAGAVVLAAAPGMPTVPGPVAAARALYFAAVACLIWLAAGAWTGRSVPGARSARALLDTLSFLGAVDVLCRDGVRLGAASRAAAVWLEGAGRVAAEALAHAIDAGTTRPPPGPLPPGWAAFLTGSAACGAEPEAIAAMMAAHRAALPVALGAALVRVELLTVAVASIGVLGVALSFWLPYLAALGNIGANP